MLPVVGLVLAAVLANVGSAAWLAAVGGNRTAVTQGLDRGALRSRLDRRQPIFPQAAEALRPRPERRIAPGDLLG